MFIYQIKNKINGKSYIGQTIKDPQERWKKHISISKKEGHKDTSYIHKALRKDGPENFVFEVIDTAKSREELDRKEQFHIKELNTLVPNGYNISTGGQFSKEIDAETRKKISESKKGENNPNWHRVFTEEERELHRQANFRRYSKLEERIKTSLKNKEVWERPGYRERMIKIIRNNVTEDFREKVSKASKEMWKNEAFRERMKKQRKESWADPKKREEMLKKRRETRSKNPNCNVVIASRWKDPEFRKKWMLARHKKIID